jgi:hypothetical protein
MNKNFTRGCNWNKIKNFLMQRYWNFLQSFEKPRHFRNFFKGSWNFNDMPAKKIIIKPSIKLAWQKLKIYNGQATCIHCVIECIDCVRTHMFWVKKNAAGRIYFVSLSQGVSTFSLILKFIEWFLVSLTRKIQLFLLKFQKYDL